MAKWTIGRNQTQKLENIWARATDAKAYALENQFRGEAVSVSWVRQTFEAFKRAKLTHETDGTYRLRVHGNEWYTFRA